MVEFGKTLLLSQDSQWKEYYVDYSKLKFLIKKAKLKKQMNYMKELKKKKSEESRHKDDTTTVHTMFAASTVPLSQKHKKNSSSLGNLLDWMQQMEQTPSSSSSSATATSEMVSSCFANGIRNVNNDSNHNLLVVSSSKGELRHMIQDGYVKALEFREVLDQQIEKLVLFTLSQEGHLAQELYRLSKQRLQLKEGVYQAMMVDVMGPNANIDSTTSVWADDVPAMTTSQCYSTLATLTATYRDFAAQLLQLVEFMDLNVTAIRKILKKHDKNFPHFKLSGTYLRQKLVQQQQQGHHYHDDEDNSRGIITSGGHHLQHTMYHFGGLSSLLLALQGAFDDLHSLEWNILALQQHQQQSHLQPPSYGSIPSTYRPTAASPVKPHSKTPKVDNRKDSSEFLILQQQQQQQQSLLSPTLLSDTTSRPPLLPHHPPGHSFRSRMVVSSSLPDLYPKRQVSLRSLFMSRTMKNDDTKKMTMMTTLPTITSAQEPLLEQIYAARHRLKETTQYAQLVAAQALIFDDDDDEDDDDTEEEGGPRRPPKADVVSTTQRKLSSMLNLASCALYMTNYYVVAPTVGEYAQQLGSNESMAGIIIGMTPNAALIASVLYGWWSNHSYRNALIFAAGSSLLGNILYALALHYNSLTMVMMGRFLNGFGSARAINRRYIADTFSKADRTAASADFVTSGALGMAMGPAIAFLLGHVSFPDGNTLWSPVTSPGWVMLSLWSTFLVLAILFFQEPDRSHIFVDENANKGNTEEDIVSVKETVAAAGTELVPTSTANEVSETQPLIISDDLPRRESGGNTDLSANNEPIKVKVEPPLWKNAAVMNSLWLYFVLKLVLEMLLSSTPTVTKYYFGWHSKISGLFMMIMALLMFPANLVVARLSQRYDDRELIVWALLMMMVSVLGILDYGRNYFLIQYVVFAIGIFLSTNCLEGPNMGLLSKTIPKSWAKGTFNSGFLATEAGTLARSVGDALISAVAGSLGVAMLVNGLFLPMSVLVGISLLLVRRYYNQLTEGDDDDTASIASLSMDESERNN